LCTHRLMTPRPAEACDPCDADETAKPYYCLRRVASATMTKKLLTIDDSKTLRMIVAKHLRPLGVEVFEAENGETGIAVAKQEMPELILLDYNMPVLDGYHTLAELKSDDSTRSIPVMMLTTETVKETVVKLIKLGLKDYIAKPFTREMLLQKVNPVLQLYDGENPPPEPTAAEQKAAAEAAAEPGKPTVLIIDDKESILKMLREHLGEQCRVMCAESGNAALSIIARERFDWMLLDLVMPDVNGFDVFEHYVRIKKHAASPRKVIAMTLRTAQSDINRAQKLGITEFLYKPFTKEDVLQLFESLAARQHEPESAVAGSRFLTEKGNVRVLMCPGPKHPDFKAVVNALGNEIRTEVNDLAEEGQMNLVIRLSPAFVSDLAITRKFISLLSYLEELSFNVRLVAESDELRSRLKQFAETASLPTDNSLEFALNAFV
jgi:two-component system cell cycle response regulator